MNLLFVLIVKMHTKNIAKYLSFIDLKADEGWFEKFNNSI
jgi:hypothetical protein